MNKYEKMRNTLKGKLQQSNPDEREDLPTN